MSPTFFIYLDGLLNLLAAAKIGYFIGRGFVGCLAYADDIVILAPTADAMHSLLAIYDSFAKEPALIFNVKKSEWFLLGNACHDISNEGFYIVIML